jgi:hemolysin III
MGGDRTQSRQGTATSGTKDQRPALRGVSHLVVAIAAPFALVVLLLLADSPRRYVGASIFATSLILLYSSSANYHLAPWPDRLRRVWKRVDHAMIFVLIAGTYTPFCLVVLSNAWGITMLSVVWSLAGAGALLKIVWPDAPRALGVGLYMAVGWVGIIPAAQVVSSLALPAILLMILGGAMYSIGGVVYARRRPDPWPRVFGYHEVFHAFVIAGSAIHFAVIATYVV